MIFSFRDEHNECGFGEGLDIRAEVEFRGYEPVQVTFDQISMGGVTLYTPCGCNAEKFTSSDWSRLYDFVEQRAPKELKEMEEM